MIRIFVIVTLVFPLVVKGQVVFEHTPEEKERKQRKDQLVKVALQGSFLFVSPGGVNEYIRDYISDHYNGQYYLISGSSSISVGAALGVHLNFKISDFFYAKVPIEYGNASKQTMLDTEPKRFSMNRFTTGGGLLYYFPAESDNAFFISGLLLFHAMSFEGFRASDLGQRIELGYTIFRFKSDWEFLFHADIASGKVSNGGDRLNTINFTGVGMGVRLVL